MEDFSPEVGTCRALTRAACSSSACCDRSRAASVAAVNPSAIALEPAFCFLFFFFACAKLCLTASFSFPLSRSRSPARARCSCSRGSSSAASVHPRHHTTRAPARDVPLTDPRAATQASRCSRSSWTLSCGSSRTPPCAASSGPSRPLRLSSRCSASTPSGCTASLRRTSRSSWRRFHVPFPSAH